MNVLRLLRYRSRALLRRAELDRELAEEMSLHLELATRAHQGQGLSPAEARRRALLEFGGVVQQQERVRDARGVRWLQELLHDIRYGWRLLRKAPVFTLIAVLSLGLGVGANAAIFSLVNAVLLRSLPVPNPQKLRVINWTGNSDRLNFNGKWDQPAGERAVADAVSYPVFEALREQSAGRAEVFGFHPLGDVIARVNGAAFIGSGLIVSDNYFQGLGVSAALGRVFTPRDSEAESAGWLVVSHGWWQERFGGDAEVLGLTVTLNDHSFEVIGVLPPAIQGLHSGDAVDFYVAMSTAPALAPRFARTDAEQWWVGSMARLAPGTSAEQFLAVADVAFRNAAGDLIEDGELLTYDGRAGLRADRDFYRRPLLILLAIVGVVVLAACANLAALSLARALSRQKEYAVRRALGAGRARLLRQSLTESLLLGLLGTAAAIPIAVLTKTALAGLLWDPTGGLSYDTSLDLRVLAFTLVLALATALLSGSVSASRSAAVDPGSHLRDRGELRRPQLHAARALLVGQIALSIVLLTGAGLYGRTLYNLMRIDPGFETEHLLLFQLDPAAAGYPDAVRALAFYDDVAERLAAIPGVRGVALSREALLSGSMSGGSFFTLPDQPANGEPPMAHRHIVNESYFTTMGIPLVLGRGFRRADGMDAPGVVVVNETFARKYFPGAHPLGQRLRMGDADIAVIGVARDARYTDIKEDIPPTAYFSFRQNPPSAAYFALRTGSAPLAFTDLARAAVSSVDARVPLARVATQEQLRNQRIAQERLFAYLCSALAGLALLLCCIGLYGLMAYSVSRRVGEIGVRVALGATRRQIAVPVLREALLLGVLGTALGLPLALLLVRIVKAQLYGVEPVDPISLAGGVGLLAAVAVFAAWFPARRAAFIDPADALRAE
jgi:predicted permease